MPGPPLPRPDSSTPSSSRSPIPAHTPTESTDDHDALASLWDDDAPGDVLGDDPMGEEQDERMTFKRKQKLSPPARFFSALTGGGSSSRRDEAQGRDTPGDDSYFGGMAAGGDGGQTPGEPLDWNAEGPGRRVAYEDMTAIDWIFEYTKERQRLRVLRSGAKGIVGYIRLLLDASQIWVILILTGIAVGVIAAGIDVTTNWLADLKTGFCSGGPDGGAFYLNKGVCCLGYDVGSKCTGWSTWGEAFGAKAGGKWFLEYFFFIMFSVRFTLGVSRPGSCSPGERVANSGQGHTRILCGDAGQGVRDIRQAQRYTRDEDDIGGLRHPAVLGGVDACHEGVGLGRFTVVSGGSSVN